MNVKHINTEYKYQQEDVDIKWYVCFARSPQEECFQFKNKKKIMIYAIKEVDRLLEKQNPIVLTA